MKTTMLPTYQVLSSIWANHELADGELEATMEAVLDALHRHATFVALGPVVTANEGERVIEVECSVMAERPEDIHEKVGRITQIMLDAANAFEYRGSTTVKLSEYAFT